MQEVIHKEIEFVSSPKRHWKCVDCHKKFKNIEKCKDGKDRCKNCKKKLVTNKFYNPNWKNRNFIGKYTIGDQERKILVKKYINNGCTYEQANRKVNYGISQLKKLRHRKYGGEKEINKNLEIKKKKDDELNRKFLEGLGMKKK